MKEGKDTGFKDKDGKPIKIGDTVQVFNPTTGDVVYRKITSTCGLEANENGICKYYKKIEDKD